MMNDELKNGDFRFSFIIHHFSIHALLADGFAHVFYRLAHFSLGSSVTLLKVTAGAVSRSIGFHVAVVNGTTYVLFHSAFGLIVFSFDLIFVR